ncbi:MAG: TIGR02757 family protein [Deltaproteobacteria bacterium]|nr:TIGR02757 family protein [Deltaproteobacteria bacterium]
MSRGRAARLAPILDRFQRGFDASARLAADPVEFPRRYPDAGDAEVAGLLAACLAYGRADVFKPRIESVLRVAAPSPAAFAARLARHPDASSLAGFRYRFNTAEDVAALLAAAGWVRGRHGSLGARFAGLLEEAVAEGTAAPLREALARFAAELRESPPALELLADRGGRGIRHLCPDPRAGGAAKRWNLYLRWMVRGPDGVDLGLWPKVPTSALLVPLDTHVARVARRLGLTRRRDLSWRTAEEVTSALRLADPGDPVRFDFALCHLGMSGRCPPRRAPERCAACGLSEGCEAGGRPGVVVSAPASPGGRGSRSARAGRS